jgi:protein-tyrosine phosphatase
MPEAGESVMIDIHSHILPGLDDGASDMDEAIRMCSIAADDGIAQVVATPHHLNGTYYNPKNTVANAVASLNEALHKHNVDVTVLPGSDVHLGTNLLDEAKAKAERIMTINNSGKFMLLELPSFFVPQHVREQVFRLKLIGVTSIITHPERNKIAMEEPGFLYDLVLAGALLQITAGSITGDFGGAVKDRAHRLMDSGMAHIVATDAHNSSSRPPGLSRAFKILSDVVGPDEARMTVLDRPTAVISGTMPLVNKPILPKKKRTILSLLGLKRNQW